MTPIPTDPYRLADLQPLRDRLIVAPLAAPSRTASGIHIVDTSHQRERPQYGLVLSVGPGRMLEHGPLPMDVHVGDCVFYGKYSGQEFELAGERVLNMSEAEVFSVLRVGTFAVVEHVEPNKATVRHLQGDFCETCAAPAEAQSKDEIERMRRQMLIAASDDGAGGRRIIEVDPSREQAHGGV